LYKESLQKIENLKKQLASAAIGGSNTG
jgi:hypothetical protein